MIRRLIVLFSYVVTLLLGCILFFPFIIYWIITGKELLISFITKCFDYIESKTE